MTQSDELERLEHEHAHLNRLVDGVRESAHACLRGEITPTDLRADVEEFLRVAQDELYEHFDREETGLFPYIAEALPDVAPAVTQLEAGHDRLCGLLSRMDRFVAEAAFEVQFEGFVSLFARFDANYTQHSRAEGALLRSIAGRLDAAQREELERLLSEL